jgi:hypothetical protein
MIAYLRPARRDRAGSRRLLLAFLLALLLALAAASRGARAAAPADSSAITADTTLVFAVRLGSRLYPDWKDSVEVKLGERFYLGDTPFTGSVTGFMPDFGIVKGRALNYSSAMNNPAIRVFVYADSGAVDSTWAFLNFPPHYSAKAFFTFQLTRVDGYRPGTPSGADEPAKKEE